MSLKPLFVRVAGLVALAVFAASCTARGEAVANDSTPPVPPPGSLTLLTEPDDGMGAIYELLSSAKRSIDVSMYELVDKQAEQLLAQAADRGVAVRVVLDANREKAANQAARTYLTAQGVHVAWADARYPATHEKAIVVDRDVAAIMSLNLTSRYYATTRDFAVIDRQPTDVAAVEAVFDADFRHAKTTTPLGADLVWSPGSEQALLNLINSARSTLLVENEEMALSSITSALQAAARRGVRVTVVMTGQSSWARDFDRLSQAHVDVHVYASNASLYIHAKAIVVDPATPHEEAFVGSENFSAASLRHNRELGLLTKDSSVVSEVANTIKADAASAPTWRRPP